MNLTARGRTGANRHSAPPSSLERARFFEIDTIKLSFLLTFFKKYDKIYKLE